MSTRSNGSAVRLDALTKGAKTQTLGIAFFDLFRFNEWFSSKQAEAAIGFLQHSMNSLLNSNHIIVAL